MKVSLLQRGLPLLGLLVSACSPLTAFNSVVPKDGGGRLAARGLAYGEGPRRRLDVYVPRGRAERMRPVIVFFYGGSWNSGERGGYAFVGRALAAQGFVTVVPDYRLVPEVTYPGFIEDGAAAVRWGSAPGPATPAIRLARRPDRHPTRGATRR